MRHSISRSHRKKRTCVDASTSEEATVGVESTQVGDGKYGRACIALNRFSCKGNDYRATAGPTVSPVTLPCPLDVNGRLKFCQRTQSLMLHPGDPAPAHDCQVV